MDITWPRLPGRLRRLLAYFDILLFLAATRGLIYWTTLPHILRSVQNVSFQHPRSFIDYHEDSRLSVNDNRQHSFRTILVWNSHFQNTDWSNNGSYSACPNVCYVYTAQHLLSQIDAVVFHPRDIKSPSDMPESRPFHQRWVLFSMEPPYYNYMQMNRYNGQFNWTMLLRNDSDFPVVYGKIQHKTSMEISSKDNIPKVNREISMVIEAKTSLVAVRISNCISQYSPRLKFIKELKKYINVDFYGKCGDIDCLDHDCSAFLKKYKFILAFENGFCRNYITEKFWSVYFNFASVPVVMGGAGKSDYAQVAPPASYINVEDFGSVRQLAQYLLYLDKNPEKYREYFNWRFHYKALYSSHFCTLCSALHNNSMPWQSYGDLEGFFLEDTCDYRFERPEFFRGKDHTAMSANVLSIDHLTYYDVFILFLVMVGLLISIVCFLLRFRCMRTINDIIIQFLKRGK